MNTPIARGGRRVSALTTPAGRLGALARSEFTLLGRSKATLLTAVLVPLVLPFSLRSVVDGMDVEEAGLSVGLVLLPALPRDRLGKLSRHALAELRQGGGRGA